MRKKKNCTARIKYFNVQRYILLILNVFLSRKNTPLLVKFPISNEWRFVNLHFHRLRSVASLNSKERISKIYSIEKSFVFVQLVNSSRVKYRRRKKKKKERERENGRSATIFLTRGERFDQRMAEGVLFHPPLLPVFFAPLSLLFVPRHVLAPFATLPFATFHIFRPLSLAAFFAKRRSPFSRAKLIDAVFLP